MSLWHRRYLLVMFFKKQSEQAAEDMAAEIKWSVEKEVATRYKIVYIVDLLNGFAITFMEFNWRWEKALNGLTINHVETMCVQNLWRIIQSPLREASMGSKRILNMLGWGSFPWPPDST